MHPARQGEFEISNFRFWIVGAFQMGPKQFFQFFGDTAQFFIKPGASVESFSFKDERAMLVEDAVLEIHPDTLDAAGTELDGEQVIITCRGLVADTAFNDGKNDVLLLPMEK